jgi:hypothetical protein
VLLRAVRRANAYPTVGSSNILATAVTSRVVLPGAAISRPRNGLAPTPTSRRAWLCLLQLADPERTACLLRLRAASRCRLARRPLASSHRCTASCRYVEVPSGQTTWRADDVPLSHASAENDPEHGGPHARTRRVHVEALDAERARVAAPVSRCTAVARPAAHHPTRAADAAGPEQEPCSTRSAQLLTAQLPSVLTASPASAEMSRGGSP